MVSRLPIMPPEISGLTYIAPLGRGGFADVFLYKQSMPSREVAVKVFVKKFQANTASAVSFLAEANNLAKLGSHPNIVNIWDANISREGNSYISMEYCPTSLGKSWRQSPLGLSEVLDIGVQIACALETVHRAGLLHRDIKPSNILINAFGTPVLSDFGIAGEISSQDTTDQVAMSLPWSSPEVVAMQTLGTVASDVWSLGATLYSLLAGRTPFEVDDPRQNENEKLKSRILKAIYTPIARGGMPRIVEEVLNKAMAKHPRDRYGSMQEFAMALNEVQAALQFMVTRLSISMIAVENDSTTEKYPCGHPKISMAGVDVGVYVQPTTGRRGVKNVPVDADQCPRCASADSFVPLKKRIKVSPVTLIIGGAVVLGFISTILILQATGRI
jgi:eukaryotic-like serine/threonine-protein kinase